MIKIYLIFFPFIVVKFVLKDVVKSFIR